MVIPRDSSVGQRPRLSHRDSSDPQWGGCLSQHRYHHNQAQHLKTSPELGGQGVCAEPQSHTGHPCPHLHAQPSLKRTHPLSHSLHLCVAGVAPVPGARGAYLLG